MWAAAVALPLLARSAVGATGATGATADTGDLCADEPDQICVPWTPEVQGECPEVPTKECDPGCRPVEVGDAVYADGQCCYPVARWYYRWSCGCGCSC